MLASGQQRLHQLWLQSQQLIKLSPERFPVAVFHCRSIQTLHKVRFYQPTLLLVLKGTKRIAEPYNQDCEQGNLLLIPQDSEFPFSNLPDDVYTALVICFEPKDFPSRTTTDSTPVLDQCQADDRILILIEQLFSLANMAQTDCELATNLWQQRRQELAGLLTHLKLDGPLKVLPEETWSQKLINVLQQDLSGDWQLAEICKTLATSESNLRRRLKEENTGFRDLLEDLRLTQGLDLLQTTQLPVNQIALECGYQSASRFSERFKKRFRTSPRELRQAR